MSKLGALEWAMVAVIAFMLCFLCAMAAVLPPFRLVVGLIAATAVVGGSAYFIARRMGIPP